MQHFVGLDVSLNVTAICVVDEDGIVIREAKVPSEPEATWLADLSLDVFRVG